MLRLLIMIKSCQDSGLGRNGVDRSHRSDVRNLREQSGGAGGGGVVVEEMSVAERWGTGLPRRRFLQG
jgi:hypothetical protein